VLRHEAAAPADEGRGLGRLSLQGERRQQEELAAWLRTLSDDELEAVHREAERRLQQEGDDADP
jgi:hypothetical protein